MTTDNGKSRSRNWLWWILVPFGLLLLAIPGMWVFMGTTAQVLHPNPNEVPTVADSEPEPKLAGPVEQAQKIVRAHISEENLPGLSVAVGIGGEIVWAEGFGYADLKSNMPVAPSHRFRLGTASTVLTSAAAGLLIEDGRLKLDDEIQTYVPGFPKKQWPVTVRELMGHTAGIVNDDGDEGTLFSKHCEQPVDALKYFAEYSLLFEPGTKYRYSSYGWILMSAAIEAAAKEPFLTFMRDRVFAPLGMRDTLPDPSTVEDDDDFPLFNLIREKVFDPRASKKQKTKPAPPKESVQDRATPYFPRYSADPNYGLHLMRPLDLSCFAGASVFLTTPSDLVRFAMGINGGKLLKPTTVQMLQTAQRLTSGAETGYGLGWDIENVTLAAEQTRVIGHDGQSLGGMVASLVTIPERGLVVAVMSNISYAETSTLALKIAEVFK